ncbi:MAG TPA: XdhC/CoxI family protein [Acidimicrobiales bacterium]|nr:XdhC/CoxI family protein [Acidimicrobiales bacterium]
MSGAGPLFAALRQALLASEPVALVTVIGTEPGEAPGAPAEPLPPLGAKLLVRPGAEPEVLGGVGSEELDRVLARDARAALEQGVTVDRHYGRRGEARRHEVSVLIESFAPPPKLVIFGAVDFTAALAAAGKLLGYRVTVCDARPVFATPRRFPAADEVVVDWPDRLLARIGSDLGPRDAVCVLTHDTKFDVPAILSALGTRVGYLGAMGSRRTHTERLARLREAGADEEALTSRLMSPIGLDIGARTPEETAVAICAEIVAHRAGAAVPSLRDRSGPIHA